MYHMGPRQISIYATRGHVVQMVAGIVTLLVEEIKVVSLF